MKFLSILIISFIICLSLAIGGLVYTAYIKNNERGVLVINQITLPVVEDKKKQSPPTDLKIKRDIENLNNSINDKITKISLKELDILKKKASIGIEYSKKIKEKWKEPFNYKKGASCYIDLYKKKNITEYKIYDCSGDALFKRSIEVSIIKNIDENNFKEIDEFDIKNKINFMFMPI